MGQWERGSVPNLATDAKTIHVGNTLDQSKHFES